VGRHNNQRLRALSVRSKKKGEIKVSESRGVDGAMNSKQRRGPLINFTRRSGNLFTFFLHLSLGLRVYLKMAIIHLFDLQH
jgi:hypothetical protein